MGNRADRVRWLVCALDFERDLKEPRKYEKLFFLDEAVALAAGHRPCRTCRRTRYDDYLGAVSAGLGRPIAGAADLDKLLHAARTGPRVHATVGTLPDGVFVALGGEHRVLWRGELHRWTPAGYDDPRPVADFALDSVEVLTPAPSVAALGHGYHVVIATG